jgi:DNA invertase Pin-like site-specific DNA recombinase
LAEKERRMISQRTKDALVSTKSCGVKLGGQREQSDITKAEAQRRAGSLRSVFEELGWRHGGG